MDFYGRLRLGLLGLIAIGSVTGEWYAAATEQHDEVGCKQVGAMAPLPGLPEGEWSRGESAEPPASCGR
jgi:hypothetical protein